MVSGLTHGTSPEGRELEKKLNELRTLENELAERELELATLRADLQAIEVRYMRLVGTRYAQLDDIEAKIAEALAERTAQDDPARGRAERARAQARESASEAQEAAKPAAREKFTPSRRLRDLYREAAKRFHPDLTTDEEERTRRNHWMAEANRAYEEGDEARLEAILAEWDSSPETVEGESVAARLVRVIRKIAQVLSRLSSIVEEIAKLQESDLFKLKNAIERARAEGRDLIDDMAGRLDREIEDARSRLRKARGHYDMK
jgi:ABC-type phosphate transport system auxiliary subunit